MFGYICYGIGGVALVATGNVILGSVMLGSAGLWLMTSGTGNDE